MKKEIMQVIHNLKVEGIETNSEMMKLLNMYDRNEISLEEFQKKVLEMAGIKC